MAALIIAAAALAVALVYFVVERRRRARRVAEALERARRRHRRAPLVSANLRGLAATSETDLWASGLRNRPTPDQAAPSSRDR